MFYEHYLGGDFDMAAKTPVKQVKRAGKVNNQPKAVPGKFGAGVK